MTRGMIGRSFRGQRRLAAIALSLASTVFAADGSQDRDARDRPGAREPASPATAADAPKPAVQTPSSGHGEPATAPVPPSAGAHGRAGAFKVFNAMLYKDMPAAGERLAVIYESAFFEKGSPDAQGLPDETGIDHALEVGRLQRGPPWFATAGLLAIDIERWSVWPFAQGEDHGRSIARYADIARRIRARTDQPICFYGIAPETAINHAVRTETDTDLRAQWQAASDVTRREFVPHVDALCPPLYSYYDSPEPARRAQHLKDWKSFARQTIAQARRIAPGKPVYPFVWPQFHAGGSISDHRFVPEQIWREQLRLVSELADGLILWGGWKFDSNERLGWDPDAEWWRVVREMFPEATQP